MVVVVVVIVMYRTEGYVKIVGVLKEFQGKVSVNIQNIEPIYDMNLIVQHILSSIASYCYYKKKSVRTVVSNHL